MPNRTQRTPPRKSKGTIQVSEVRQQQVAALRAQNVSKRAIGRKLGMATKTIQRILSQGEYQIIVQQGRSKLAELVPRAADVLGYFLTKKRMGRLTDKSADVAIAILTGLQVFIPKTHTDVGIAQPNKYDGWTKEQILEYINTGKKPNEEEF